MREYVVTMAIIDHNEHNDHHNNEDVVMTMIVLITDDIMAIQGATRNLPRVEFGANWQLQW